MLTRVIICNCFSSIALIAISWLRLMQRGSLIMEMSPIFLFLCFFRQAVRRIGCKGKGRATARTHTLNLFAIITSRLIEAKSTLWTFNPHIVIAYDYLWL